MAELQTSWGWLIAIYLFWLAFLLVLTFVHLFLGPGSAEII